MPKQLLLISDHPEDASFVAQVANVTQAKIEIAPNAQAGVEFLSRTDCNAVFVDVTKQAQLQAFEAEIQKQLGLFSDKIQANQVHFISATDIAKNREAVISPLFGSFFERPTKDVEEIGQYYGRFVQASENKTTHDLGHFLQSAAKIQSVTLTNTGQKQDAAEAVRQYLISAKIPARISNIIANAVDELLMNALFDAPSDDFGRPLYSSTSRNQIRELKTPKEQVKMNIGFDGNYIGVSVSDGYGSVDRQRLLNHVSTHYQDRDYQIKQGQAGAGLGISTVFRSGGSLIFHCEQQLRTEVTLLYRAYPMYKDFKAQFNFFSAKFYV